MQVPYRKYSSMQSYVVFSITSGALCVLGALKYSQQCWQPAHAPSELIQKQIIQTFEMNAPHCVALQTPT